jgi:transcriptional regulator with XRE-family HTH domain
MNTTEYSVRIRKLRGHLGLTQYELAERLHVRPQVVASWEQGRKEPAASSYSQLALLAPPKEAWFFLEQIGVSRKLVRTKWSDRTPLRPAGRPAGARTRIRAIDMSDPGFLQIPLLRDRLPLNPAVLDQEDFEGVIRLPASMLPRSLGVCVGIRNHGAKLAPVLPDQGIAVVDTTRRAPAQLAGRMVGLWGDHGPMLRWLARSSKQQAELSRQIQPPAVVRMDPAEAARRIIGDVVFWCGRQK